MYVHHLWVLSYVAIEKHLESYMKNVPFSFLQLAAHRVDLQSCVHYQERMSLESKAEGATKRKPCVKKFKWDECLAYKNFGTAPMGIDIATPPTSDFFLSVPSRRRSARMSEFQGEAVKYGFKERARRFYRGTLFQAIIVGLVSFTQPGIWNALNSKMTHQCSRYILTGVYQVLVVVEKQVLLLSIYRMPLPLRK